jgi:hypothetical protein
MDRIFPEEEYVIKTRPPTVEGNTWKQNVQLKIREEQLSDEAMPIARYLFPHPDASATIPPWITSPAHSEKASSGSSSTVRKNFTMWLSARNESIISKWTNAEETQLVTLKNGGNNYTVQTERWGGRRRCSSET